MFATLVATYTQNLELLGEPVVLQDYTLYGAGRLGTYNVASSKVLYELTDHLGNVRAVVTKNNLTNLAEVLSYTDYYPHGGVLPGRNYVNSLEGVPYQYQGVEKDAETNLLNFELRQFDARLGRWQSPDPMGQHHSPYLSMSNNPVSFADPTGGWDEEAYGQSLYDRYTSQYNPDANSHSEFDNNYNHGGPLGGSINPDGSFYSSNEQIYDAQVNNLKFNHPEYYMDEKGNWTGTYLTTGSFNGYDKDGKPISQASQGVDDPNSTILINGAFQTDYYTQDEVFSFYGINKQEWQREYKNRKAGVQDIDAGQSAKNANIWKAYGKSSYELAKAGEYMFVGQVAFVGVIAGGFIAAPYLAAGGEVASSRVLMTSWNQLQKKFLKHAADFGIKGGANRANLARFNSAINQHINSPFTQIIKGSYRGKDVIHYLNPQTGLNVISSLEGEFISGWRLSAGQLSDILTKGFLW